MGVLTLWLPSLEAAVLTFILGLTLFYAWVAVTRTWRSRRPVVWDYERQQWRSAWLVKQDRAHAPRRCG